MEKKINYIEEVSDKESLEEPLKDILYKEEVEKLRKETKKLPKCKNSNKAETLELVKENCEPTGLCEIYNANLGFIPIKTMVVKKEELIQVLEEWKTWNHCDFIEVTNETITVSKNKKAYFFKKEKIDKRRNMWKRKKK